MKMGQKQQEVEYTLLDPLMGSDSEIRQDIEFKPLNRRNHLALATNKIKNESCSRARLFVVAILAFIVIYVSIGISREDLPQIIVRVPPDDNGEPESILNPDHPPSTAIPVTSTTTTTVNSLNSSSIKPVVSTSTSTSSDNANVLNDSLTVPEGYLVWSPQCKIASLDPMAKDVMRLYHREKPISCTKGPSLTKMEWNPTTQRYYLVVVAEAKKAYHYYNSDGFCTYEEVSRKTENKISLAGAIKFTYKVELGENAEFIYVECFNKGKKQPIYKDVHFIVQQKSSVLKRLSALSSGQGRRRMGSDQTQTPSVLMIGIDSISRLNFLRAMPKTAQHIYDTGWFEMKGYNKMGDNTYPNLMAILTGYNQTWAYEQCHPYAGLDDCPFVWNDYAAAGFVTGYAEDEPEIGTFNYKKVGFNEAPTDFYGRAGLIAAQRLPKVMRSSLAICLGDRSAADYVYQYGLDVAQKFKPQGTFGLYWTNSFSHNDLNSPSLMDDRIKFYIEDLERRNLLNDTIVIFFSDHGLRFGPVRKLITGWMEERLPFLFFWLPPWFQDRHPEIVKALQVNKNRLTNPYDLHLTLKHILRLSGRAPALENGPRDMAMGCENCQSMFNEVPWNRSCEEIGIASHWCTCAPYLPINKNSNIVKKVTRFLIEYINKDIKRMLNGTVKANGEPLCAELRLGLLEFVGETEYKADYNDILITFETKPGGGEFESTVRYFKATGQIEVTGTISRLNTYSKHSKCVTDLPSNARMFCECL